MSEDITPGSDERTLRRHRESFLDSTTAHGLSRIKGPDVLRRTIWQIVLLTCFASVVYLLYGIAVKLSYPPMSTKITTHLEDSVQLPALTICNNNMYNKTAVFTDPNLAYLASVAIQSVLESQLSQQSKDGLLKSFGLTMEEAQSILALNRTAGNITEVYINSSHTNQATIIQALNIANGRANLYDNISSQLTDMGNCYVYDNPDHLIKVPGVSGGVLMFLHVHPELYSFSENDYYHEGFKIVFHEHGDHPLMKDFGMGLTHGLSHMIGLRKTKKAYSERDNCVQTDHRGEASQQKLSLFPTYSKNNCLRECEVNFTAARCHCKLFYQPGDLPVCSNLTSETECINQMYNFNTHPDGKAACNCPVACEEVEYDTRLSSLTFPSQFYRDVSSYTDGYNETWAGQLAVNIYMETMEVTTVEQVETYGFRDVWGDLGGCLGLCLGASLITIVEIIEFGIVSLLRVFNGGVTIRKKHIGGQNKKQIPKSDRELSNL